jgi:hypothetical protein
MLHISEKVALNVLCDDKQTKHKDKNITKTTLVPTALSPKALPFYPSFKPIKKQRVF